MTRTTPPRPVDVEMLFPEVAAYRKDTVRLHPRAGDPGPRESSLGGPLLWPRSLDWPHCDEDHGGSGPGAGAMPLVPVLQLFATDVPELPFPAGTDVLQVLWCPFEHGYIPQPKLYWRDSSTCEGELTEYPRPEGAEEDYLPDPCVLHPERVVDYPSWDLPDEIAEALEERFARVEKETGWSYWQHLSVADGVKVGGYPTWTQEPFWPDCAACGQAMDHLLTVNSAEFDGESWRAWLPVEDTPETGTIWDLPYDDRRLIQSPPGLTFGDMGGIYLFTCQHCPDRPYSHWFDCS
ncbi:DUF1963 domain-containing protein [Streptomyces sp. NPDC090499]|uniref:DUF1963 domain-containing protein n=1 Tax=unclassified Streptomyces TaxID=2593676 RepID=UPI003818F74C